MIFHAYAAYS